MHGSLASLQAQRRQHLALELLLVEDAASTDSAPARPAGVGNQAAEPDSPSPVGPTARRAAAQLRRCYPSAVGIVEAAASGSPTGDSGPALRPAWCTGSSEGSGRPPATDGDTGAPNGERNIEDLTSNSGANAAALIPSAGTGWPRKRLPWAEEAAAELRARAEAQEAQRSAAEAAAAAAAAAAASGSSSSLGGSSSRLVSVRDPDWAKPWIAESKQDRRGAGSMFALVDAEPDGDGATAPESRGGRSAAASSLSETSVGKARFDAVYTALREQAAVFAAAVREVRGIAGPGWPRARGAAIAAAIAEPTTSPTSTSSHGREEAPSPSAGPALPPDGDPAAARGTIADSVDPLVLRVAVRNWVLRAAGQLPALAGLERVAADRDSDEASSATGAGASREASSAAAGPSTPSRPTASSTSSTSTANTSGADAARARTSASSPSGTSTPTAAKPSALDALALAARGLSDDALTQELQRTATRMRQAFRTTYVTPARSADIKLRAILDDHSRALAAMHLATAQGGKGLSTDNLKRANEGKSSMVVFDSLAWMSHGPDPDWDSCRSLLRSLRPQLLQPAASGGGGGGGGGGGAGAVAGVTRRGPKDRAAAVGRATGGGGGGGGGGGAEATAAAAANRAAGVGQAARVPRRDLAMAQRVWAGFLDSMAAAQSRYEAAWKMAAREQRKGSRGDAGGGGSSGRRRRKGSADGEGGSGSDSDVGFLGNSRMQLMELNKPLKLLRAAVAGLVLMSAVGEGEVRVPDELLDPLLCAAVTFMFSAQKRVHPHVGASPTQLYHIVLYSMGLSCDIRFIHRDPLDPGSSSSPSSPRSSSHHNSGAAAAGFTVNEMAAYRVAHLHAFIRFQHDWFGSWLSALLARSRPESYHVLALTRLARLVDEQQLLPYEQLQLQLAQQQQQQQQHGQESEPPPGTGWHRAVQESAAAVPVEAAAAIEAAAAEVASVAWWHALEQEQESRIKGQQLELRDQQAQNGRPQGRGAGSGGGDPLTRFGGPGNDDDDDDDDHSDTDWLTGGRLQPLGAVARAPLRDSEAVRQAAALADVVLRPSDHQSELLLGRVSRALRLAAEQGLLAAPACSGSGSGDCSGWGAAGTGAGDAVGAEAAAVPLRRALAAAAARRLDSGLELLQTFMQTIMRANVTRDLVPFCRRLANALFTSFVREVKHGKAALGTDEIFAHLLLGSAAVSAEDCRRLVWDLVPEAAPAAPGQAQARLQARTPGGSGDGGGGNGDVGWGWNWTEALRLAVAEEQAPNWRKLVGLRPGGAAAAAANSRAIEGSGVGDGAPGAVQVVRYATLGLVLGRYVGLLQPHSGAQRAAGPGVMAPEQQQARAREPGPRGLSFAHCLAAGVLTEELRQLGGLRVDQGAGQVGTSNSDTGASLDALMLALLRGAHFLHFLTTVPPALVPMLGGGHAAAEEAGHSGGGAGIADMGGAVAQTQGQQDGGHCGGGGAEAGRAAGTSREEGAGAAGGGPAAGASQLRRQQMRALQQLQGLARLYFREPMLAHQLARCLADFNKRRQDKHAQTPGHDGDGVGGAGGPWVSGAPEQLLDEWRMLVSILALRGGVGR